MTHFVCTGDCEGQSSVPGVCQGEGCKKEGEPLVECNCDSGEHKEVMDTEKPIDPDLE